MSKEKKPSETETQTLEDFNWDSNETFFGVEPVVTEEISQTSKVIKDVLEDDDDNEEEVDEIDDEQEKAKETKKEPKKQVKTEEEPFSGKTETSNDDDDDEGDKKFFTQLSKEFKEKGVFTKVEFAENEEIDEEKFFELHETEIDNRADERVAEVISELGDDGKAWYEFIKAGGNSADFFRTYNQAYSLPVLDMEKEADQDAALSFYLRNYEQLDEEDIKDRLDWLKESGKKQKQAQKVYDKLKEEAETLKQKLIEDQANAKKELEKKREKLAADIKALTAKVTQVNDYTFSTESKKVLSDYITKPTVKIGNNGYISKFQDDLNSLIKSEDKTKLLLLAELIRSNFDFSSIEKTKQTKVVDKIKSNLSESRSTKLSSVSNSKNRSLADYFGK